MHGEFLKTNAVPGSRGKVADAICEGILSPCFLLVRTAEQAGKLDELRQHIEAIPDPFEPYQLRVKLAMLLMVQSAQGKENAALELCLKLSQQVRVRDENHSGQWWPVTLEMALFAQAFPVPVT